jgi:hypothetical protein
MHNASNSQAFRDLSEHRSIFDIDNLPGGRLDDVQRKPKNVLIRLVEVDEARGNEGVHKIAQLELSYPILIQFAPFVTNHSDLEPISNLKPGDKRHHFGMRFGLREHEGLKLGMGERPFFMENDAGQIFFQRQLSHFVGSEDQAVTILHVRQVEFEVRCSAFASVTIPAVAK